MRARRLAVGIAVLALGLAATAPAQELSVAVSGGTFSPGGTAYRDVYGAGSAIAADLLFKLRGPFGIATGFTRVADEGLAVPLDGGDEEYPLEFSRTTVPIVLFYQFDIGKIDIRLGAGVGIHSFEETWTTVDIAYKDHKVSTRFALDVAVEVLSRVSVFGSARYDSIRTGVRSPLAVDVNLGGVLILGGLSFRII